MKQSRLRQNTLLLAVMILFAGIYTGWLYLQGTLTGTVRLDGAIGVLLGLYIASHPAGNMLDILLFMKSEDREQILATHSGRFWLALNGLALLAAWFVIFIGVLHFVKKEV